MPLRQLVAVSFAVAFLLVYNGDCEPQEFIVGLVHASKD